MEHLRSYLNLFYHVTLDELNTRNYKKYRMERKALDQIESC